MYRKPYHHILLPLVAFFLCSFIFIFAQEKDLSYVKALHVMSVISWLAGMLYLPRLFVYHAQCKIGSNESEIFKLMERRLLENIMNPAIVLTWGTGLCLAFKEFHFQGGWLHTKIFLVFLLSGCHGYFHKSVRYFSLDKNKKTHTFWRILNEVPTLLMILIVLLVILKPF